MQSDNLLNSFSFNSPKGACEVCNGIGSIHEIDLNKVIPDYKISIKQGGIAPIGVYKNSWIFKQLKLIASRFEFSLDDPISKIPEKALDIILNGGNEKFDVSSKDLGITRNYEIDFEGIVQFIENQHKEAASKSITRWAQNFMVEKTCPSCNGSRLKKEALYFKINNCSIADLTQMDLDHLGSWFDALPAKLNEKQKIITISLRKTLLTQQFFLVCLSHQVTQ